MRRPDRTLATADHNVPTDGTDAAPRSRTSSSRVQVQTLERNCAEFGIPLYSLGSEHQGIVHVIGPELGVTQPGMTIVCGDSHTATHGAFGALAFGIGTSEVEHVLATQCLVQSKPKSMRIRYEGALGFGVTAKDLILATIGQIGVDGAVGHVVEYAGAAIRALSMEGRMTVCNMTIEGGGRAGMIAPDETTFAYVDRPPGARRRRCPTNWRELPTDPDARFDREIVIDASAISPMVTWGTTPGMVVGVDDTVPELRARAGRTARSTTWACRPARRSRRSRSTASSSARARTRGSGTCAPPRRSSRAGGSPTASTRWSSPARTRSRRRPRPRGSTGSSARRFRLARGGLLDVPRHEPRHRGAGRARRLDLQPQLRGPPGPRRAHAPRLAARWPPRPRSRAISSTSATGGARADESDRDDHRAVSVLNRDDVDTDQIIPKQFLKRIERTGFGEFLFYDWAKEPDWDLPANPILVAGRNFGCGSSREHAPWALEDYGFQASIAPSFADIFRSNCTKIGLLPVALPAEDVRSDRGGRARRRSTSPPRRSAGRGGRASFEIDAESKYRLLNGLDDIGLTLGQRGPDRRLRARPGAERPAHDRDRVNVSGSRDWDAATYDRVSGPQLAWAKEQIGRLALRGNEVVLDAGCGSGRVTALLAELVPEGRVYGVDVAPSMVAHAREALGDRITFMQQDLLELALPEPVDVVFSNATFHWIGDHAALFARLHGAMAPGGRLVAQCGGKGNIAAVPATRRCRRARGAVRAVLRELARPMELRRTRGDCRAARGAPGSLEVETWLEDKATPLEDPRPFVSTVCLVRHLDQLPADLREPFIDEVMARSARPFVLGYVRLNMLARRT